MGRSIHSLSGLDSPLSLIDERFTDLPPETDISFLNRNFKLLLFLEADHELLVEAHPPLPIRGGDLLVMPLPVRQTYRAARRKAASRIHAMRIVLDLPMPGRKPPRPPAAPGLRAFLAGHLTGVRHLPRFLAPALRQTVARIGSEIEGRRPGYRFEAGNLALSLVIEAVRQLDPARGRGPSAGIPPTKAETSVARVKEYLIENLAAPLTLDQIAWHVRLSREHLARMFHRTTGQTVFAHLAQLRLDAAKTHLCNPNLLVAEVARRAGFSSVPFFCRTFKRALGLTPLDYRIQRMGEVRFSPSRYVRPSDSRRVIRAGF